MDHVAIAGTAADAQTTAQNTFTAEAANLQQRHDLERNRDRNRQFDRPRCRSQLHGDEKQHVHGAVRHPDYDHYRPVDGRGRPTYIDFYLLLDATPSMGVGATTADINKMVTNTSDQCAFACHDLNNPNNYYNMAKRLGVTMRIDVLKSATQSLMNNATAIETLPNQYRMAVYTFGTSATNAALTNVVALTSNLAGAQSSINNIDLMTVNGQNQNNDQDTNYNSILPAINNVIPASGPGTQASPQKVLFFVSDGVADEYNPHGCSQQTVSNGRCQEPLNDALCTAIKNRGIQIAVLYTTYLPLPTNNWYN